MDRVNVKWLQVYSFWICRVLCQVWSSSGYDWILWTKSWKVHFPSECSQWWCWGKVPCGHHHQAVQEDDHFSTAHCGAKRRAVILQIFWNKFLTFWKSRLVYSSNARSIDFCPIEDIDANSTVMVSISTESRVPVDVMIRVLIKGRSTDWKKSDDQK